MTLKKDGITLVDSGGGVGSTVSIADGVNPAIEATVFDLPNSNPLAVELVDTNGDPIVGFPTSGVDDVVTGNIALITDVVSVATPGNSQVFLKISGSFVALLLFEQQMPDGTWTSCVLHQYLNMTNVGSFASQTTSSNRTWMGAVMGTAFRVSCSTFTSGTVTINIVVKPQSFPFVSLLAGTTTGAGTPNIAFVDSFAQLKVTLVTGDNQNPIINNADGVSPIGGVFNPIIAAEGILFNGATYDRMRGDVANGLDVDVTRTAPLADTTASGTLNAINAAITIALTGQKGVGFQLSGGTFIGIIEPQISTDGGTTWAATQFYSASTQLFSSALVYFSNNTPATVTLVVPGGTSHVRVIATSYTSGTANGALRTSQTDQMPITNQTVQIVDGAFGTFKAQVDFTNSLKVTGPLTDTQLSARLNTLGQKTMALSAPVVIASDQAAIPITGSISATSAATATALPPTNYVEGVSEPLSQDLAGNLRTIGINDTEQMKLMFTMQQVLAELKAIHMILASVSGQRMDSSSFLEPLSPITH